MEDIDFTEFTESGYRKILRSLREEGYNCATFDGPRDGKHVVLRHDVDISMHRAAAIAKIEQEEGFKSTFFVLARSQFYCLAEKDILNLVASIKGMGHDLGLHFDGAAFGTINWTQASLAAAVSNERDLVEFLTRSEIKAVTYHNPDLSNLLEFRNEKIAGLVNGYSHRMKDSYVYCSDSNGYWRYEPMPSVIKQGHEALYLLTHPEWWTPEAMSPAKRVARAIQGRADATQRFYDAAMKQGGRMNVA